MAKKIYVQKGENSNDLLARAISLREAELAIKLLDNKEEKKEKKEDKEKKGMEKLTFFQTWMICVLTFPIAGPAIAGIWKVSAILLQRILQ